MAWGVVAQAQATREAQASLAAQGVAPQQVLVTPTPFNSLLWRVVAVAGDHYYEGFYSLLDTSPRLAFDRFERGSALEDKLPAHQGVQQIREFSQGFYKLHERAGRASITDLRMGQEPNYIFSFAAQRGSGLKPLEKSEQVGTTPDMKRALAWLWRRMWGEPLPPPR